MPRTLMGPPLGLLPSAANGTALRDWTAELIRWVAGILDARVRPIRFMLLQEQEDRSFTRPSRGGSAPVIVISRNRLTIDVAAHEICHALAPTPHLFLSEGLANFVGCLAVGNCSHLLFPHGSLTDLLNDHWATLPSIEPALAGSGGEHGAFDAKDFTTLQGRLGHAVAASFAEFCVTTYPGFAARVALEHSLGPRDVVEAASNSNLKEVVSLWHDWRRRG